MRRLLVLLLLAVLAPAAAAHAATMRAAGPFVDAPRTDVSGTLAYQPTRETIRVVAPDGSETDGAAPAGCWLTGVRDDTVLWSCPLGLTESSSRGTPLLQDVNTGAFSRPAALAASPYLGASTDANSYDDIRPTAIGRSWILGVVSGYHWQRYVWLPRFGPLRQPRGAPTAQNVIDLDDESGVQAVCAPLARTADEMDMGQSDGWLPFAYAKPWALASTETATSLRRCGSKNATPLPCPRCATTLFGGRLAWVDDRRVSVRDLRRGTVRRWTVPGDRLAYTGVRLTPTAVYVTRTPSSPTAPPSDRRLYRASLR